MSYPDDDYYLQVRRRPPLFYSPAGGALEL